MTRLTLMTKLSDWKLSLHRAVAVAIIVMKVTMMKEMTVMVVMNCPKSIKEVLGRRIRILGESGLDLEKKQY